MRQNNPTPPVNVYAFILLMYALSLRRKEIYLYMWRRIFSLPRLLGSKYRISIILECIIERELIEIIVGANISFSFFR
jgi:hypothetical protein